MKNIFVYHNRNPHALFRLGVDPDYFSNVTKVAQVATEDLGEAYASTNHIDSCWMHNPNVRAEPGNHRSTSMGDVLEKDGVRYVVTARGFEPL